MFAPVHTHNNVTLFRVYAKRLDSHSRASIGGSKRSCIGRVRKHNFPQFEQLLDLASFTPLSWGPLYVAKMRLNATSTLLYCFIYAQGTYVMTPWVIVELGISAFVVLHVKSINHTRAPGPWRAYICIHVCASELRTIIPRSNYG